ncbi:MAG: ATP-binding protein [Clostridia bacterium]|nr:ATP-binding protein [Clostridia bacterium]
MLRELSLNILDIVENSVKAGAKNIRIEVSAKGNDLKIVIADDGCGMDEEFLSRVTDPFTTTRTTRKVGMGLPLLKMEAEMSGGMFDITSAPGKGTMVKSTFKIDNIDRPPLGDISSTIISLIADLNEGQELVFKFEAFGNEFSLDTSQIKRELDPVRIDEPTVLVYLKDMIKENIITENGGVSL